jgi:predicted DNA-binding transcriptional regulator YafY
VRIFANRATFVMRELGADAVRHQHADGSIDVVVPCVNRDAFRSWLMGMTINAVVLEPAELREEIIGWLNDVAGSPR